MAWTTVYTVNTVVAITGSSMMGLIKFAVYSISLNLVTGPLCFTIVLIINTKH